nr:hypothetical protein [uncultured Albidiferax sp.]
MSSKPTHIRQVMLDSGLNSFGADLLCESFLKSPLAAQVLKSGKPLNIDFPIRRSDCADWLGVELSLWPVEKAEGAAEAGSLAACTMYQRMAQDLVSKAERDSVVLTIEQQALQPLAMGHYSTVVAVRPQRPLAGSEGGAA